MGTVAEMRRGFEQAAATIDVLVKEIMDSGTDELIDLLQANLSMGLDGNDDYITPLYKFDAYAKKKQERGSRAPFGVPDLKYTGGFYDRMVVEWFSADGFSIISEDTKFRKLMRQYGLNVMKLSEGAIQYFRVNHAHPQFIRKIASLTGAEFS